MFKCHILAGVHTFTYWLDLFPWHSHFLVWLETFAIIHCTRQYYSVVSWPLPSLVIMPYGFPDHRRHRSGCPIWFPDLYNQGVDFSIRIPDLYSQGLDCPISIPNLCSQTSNCSFWRSGLFQSLAPSLVRPYLFSWPLQCLARLSHQCSWPLVSLVILSDLGSRHLQSLVRLSHMGS